MGFNPLEKMKQAAYDNTVGKAKEAAENAKMNAKMFAEEKASELGTKAKDSAIDAAKKLLMEKVWLNSQKCKKLQMLMIIWN